MADINLIQKIRQQTGAGMMDVKRALQAAGGDEQKTLEFLRKMGQKIAAKKQAEREAKDGLIEAYVHANGKVAALVLLSCETDFVAKNQDFKNLAHEIALQVAAMNPQYISAQDVPAETVAQEKEVYAATLANEKKTAAVMEKIIAGKLSKYFEEVCLLEQKFIKDDKKTIKQLVDEATVKLGEKIEVKRIVRLQI